MPKKKPNPFLIDEINPECTREDFRTARPVIELFTELYGKEAAEEFVYRKRGRPKQAKTKTSTNIRFDTDLLEALRATGRGWQTRANDVLRTHFIPQP